MTILLIIPGDAISRRLSPRRSKNHHLRGVGDDVAVAKKTLEFLRIAEMAIAHDPKFTTLSQCIAGFHEHLPGRGIADGMVFVERRIVEYKIEANRELCAARKVEQAVSHDEVR